MSTPEEAEELGLRGSPTVLVNGRDPFMDQASTASLSCRIYRTPGGLRDEILDGLALVRCTIAASNPSRTHNLERPGCRSLQVADRRSGARPAPQSLEAWHTNCYRGAQSADRWQVVWAQETPVATD